MNFHIKEMKSFQIISKLIKKWSLEDFSSDREKLLKFEAEGQEFVNFLRSLEQFIQTVKVKLVICHSFFVHRILSYLSSLKNE